MLLTHLNFSINDEFESVSLTCSQQISSHTEDRDKLHLSYRTCVRILFFLRFLRDNIFPAFERSEVAANFSICFKETGGSLKSRCSCVVSYQFLQKQ